MDALPARPISRFDMDAVDFDGASRYFRARAVQGLMEAWRWSGRVEALRDDGTEWGARTTCRDATGTLHQSVYVYAGRRGHGHLSRYVASTEVPFVTGPDCDLERFFKSRAVPYVLAGRFTLSREYRAVEAFYGDTHAARSGAHYMNHIDEGLAVLHRLGASERARRAFCLHPLVQLDAALPGSYERLGELTDDARVLVLAMEYRNVANACLSRREIAAADEIALGPLPEVHDMLRADKVQNYKDFLLYHRDTHPRREALRRYFAHWLARLEVTPEQFAGYFAELQATPDPVPLPLPRDVTPGRAAATPSPPPTPSSSAR